MDMFKKKSLKRKCICVVCEGQPNYDSNTYFSCHKHEFELGTHLCPLEDSLENFFSYNEGAIPNYGIDEFEPELEVL